MLEEPLLIMAHLVAIALALKPHGVARGLETGQRRQQACLCLVDTELQALAQLRLAQQPGRLRASTTRTRRTTLTFKPPAAALTNGAAGTEITPICCGGGGSSAAAQPRDQP